MRNEFSLKIPGKWILLGEHAVVRGGPALAFPLPSKTLNLHATIEKCSSSFSLVASNKESAMLVDAFLRALKSHALFSNLPNVCVKLHVDSTISTSSGQGSSAAICTAAAQLFHELSLIQKSELFTTAHAMENYFHGISSGLDIAAVQSKNGIYFQKSTGAKELKIESMPKFYLLDSGTRSSTKDCVEKVQKMKNKMLDDRMNEAVEIAKKSLEEKLPLAALAEAIQMGNSCFQEWGLINPEMKSAEEFLLQAGALAVKPTGSGNGGFLLSLWNTEANKNLPLIPCF